MINIFELSAGVARTKHLTKRESREVSPVRTNKPDVKKSLNPIGAYVDNREITSNVDNGSSTRKSTGTPMKMLIEEEMLKEIESKRRESNIVARLMGLDNDFPSRISIPAAWNDSSQGLLHSVVANVPGDNRQENKDGCLKKVMPCDCNRPEMIQFKDIYETRSETPRTSFTSNQYVLRRSGVHSQNEEKMALVRRKFIEANYLRKNENARQAEEFDNSLRILKSNRDFCTRFFKEPNPLFSKMVKDLHGISSTSQTTSITVLKPSNTAESEKERIIRKQQYGMIGDGRLETNLRHWGSSHSHIKARSFPEPARIVVLKPSTETSQTVENELSSSYNLAMEDQQSDFYDDSEDSEDEPSTSIVNMIDHQATETSNWPQSKPQLLPLDNSYISRRDGISFDSSETEYTDEDDDSVNGSENEISTFRHPWDFVNNDQSHSFSSCSRYSSEASVIKEAKRRLSERWALGVADGIIQEQMQLPQRSRTLGEMLASSSVKNDEFNCENGLSCRRSCGNVNDANLLKPFFISGANDAERETSTNSLSRSKSVPISSNTFENIVLKLEDSGNLVIKTNGTKEISNPKKGESLKGRVSKFFFPRRKKATGGKLYSPAILASEVETRSDIAESSVPLRNVSSNHPACPSVLFEGSVPLTTDISTNAKISAKANISNSSEMKRAGSCESSKAKQDKSGFNLLSESPVYFQNDQSANANSELHFLSRVSPISSVRRTLSWDDDHIVSSPTNNDKSESNFSIQKLFRDAGSEDSGKVLEEWHSLDSPLNSLLLDKLDTDNYELNYKEKKSRRMLLFDNASSTQQEAGRNALPSAEGTCSEYQKDQQHIGVAVSVKMWRILADYFLEKGSSVSRGSDDVSVVIARTLRIGIGEKEWTESMRLEVDEIGIQLSYDVLKDLIIETLTELTAPCACC